MQDMINDFGDLDGYVELPPSISPAPISKNNPLDLPDIPTQEVKSLTGLIPDPIAKRRDKPVAYVPRAKAGLNPNPVNNNSNTTPDTSLEPFDESYTQTGKIVSPAPTKERTGSINKISTPPTAPLTFIKTDPVDQDQDLIEMAATYDVFSLSMIADYQVVSPTSAEFIAQYYRLANNMIAKVTLNQLVSEPIEVSNMWLDGKTTKTLNISGNTVYSYDDIYRYCVQDSVVDLLRAKYKSKQIHFTQMQTHQIMGAGNGISSAQQAAYYLEKMATASFSSTIGMLVFRKRMVKIRDWFENTLQVSNTTRSSIRNLIQDAVIRTSEAQAAKYKDDEDVFVVKHHRCILFAKKLLNRHSNNQLPDSHLQLSILVFLMSGVSEAAPLLGNIGFQKLYDGMLASPSLVDSLVNLSYESHRHCYPINELSHL